MSLLNAHDALVLLKNSISMPRLLYTLRTSECDDHPLLLIFDTTLRSCLRRIVNVDFNNYQWLQATLPVQNEGLGIRSAMMLASSTIKRVQDPAHKELTGLDQQGRKRPNGSTLIPWAKGKPMAWDITVPDTFADSHVSNTATEEGAAAKHTATQKTSKYASLTTTAPPPLKRLGLGTAKQLS